MGLTPIFRIFNLYPMNLWHQKLLAYLHDPPEKAYDYSPEHGKRAQHYAGRVGLDLAQWQEKLADYTAAAADRFVFPATKRKEGGRWIETGVPGLGGGVRFIHPLSGSLVSTAFPDEELAMSFCREGFPDFAGIEDPKLRFWLMWRLWRQYTVEISGAKSCALGLASLPADTRIADATIWHHDAVVSALEAARDSEGRFSPAFLLFRIGPVQEFIAQARSTRDLWSGSYLLSWMMANVMRALADELGPDVIIYPNLRGQPLYDWLEQDKLKKARHRTAEGRESATYWEDSKLTEHQDLVLTPNLPNRFLAVVPSAFKPGKLERVICANGWDTEAEELPEWARIARSCWRFLNQRCALPSAARELWDFQVSNFWQVTWELWPWQDVETALKACKGTPFGKDSALHIGHLVALGVPDAHKDARCYRSDLKEIENSGWAWSSHYQLLAHRLDARRQTCEFAAWRAGNPSHKDYFSGKEEVIATKDWLSAARKNAELSNLFRSDDELGALNLIKRVWHKAYLERLNESNQGISNLSRARESFDSVMAVAGAPFAHRLLNRTASNGRLRDAFLAFMEAASNARDDFPDSIATPENDERGWFRRTDASVFFAGAWEHAIAAAAGDDARSKLALGLEKLKVLLRECKDLPSKYYAALALDGDQIGKWLSGEMTPAIKNLITEKAASYFREKVKGVDVESWLKSGRPLSPSYHLQFSEALANFGLYCARRIVEAHFGQLIYSGGDDVLAILPAEEAIGCGQGLRLAFQGKSGELAERYPGLFQQCPEGFVQLAGKNKLNEGDWNRGCQRPSEPSWPLLVPGPKATVSVGISIGHIKEPLQDMVAEAQAAEKRAKAGPEREVFNRRDEKAEWKLSEGWDRDALAITLFKRSGETLRWGAKFDSAAFPLLRLFQRHFRSSADSTEREAPISGKFPYRVAELLGRYEIEKPLTAELVQIAQSELKWVIQQQTWTDEKAEKANCGFLRSDLETACSSYLQDLLKFSWRRPENRQGVPTSAARSLREFINLFLTEAFVARQGD